MDPESDGEIDVASRSSTAVGYSVALASLVAIGVGVLWWRFHAPPPARGLLFPADLIDYFYPLKTLAASRLRTGDLPLWNPFSCSGIPLFATMQVATLYPSTLLNVWLGAERGIPIAMFVETVLAGWFAVALFRSWRCSDLASGVGALTFVFACVLGQSFWPPEVSTILWLPWLFLCVERLVDRWQWRWWWGLCAGTGLQIVAGFPQFVVYTYYLLVPYAILRSVSGGRTVPVLIGIFAAVGLGVGAAAVQLLPTIELVGESSRAAALTASEADYLAVGQLSRLLTNTVVPDPKLVTFDYGTGMGYLGIATLLSIAAGLATGFRRPWIWTMALFAIATALLSDGPNGIGSRLYAIYEFVPAASMFRTPERLRLIALFCAIAIGVFGLDAIDGEKHPRATRLRALVAALIAALAIALVGKGDATWRAAVVLGLMFAIAQSGNRPAIRRLGQIGLAAFALFDLSASIAPHGSMRSFPASWSQAHQALNHVVASPDQIARLVGRSGHARIEVVGEPRTGIIVRPPLLANASGQTHRMGCYEPLLPRQWAAIGRATQTPSFVLDNLDPDRHAAPYDLAAVRWIAQLRAEDPDRPARVWFARMKESAAYYSTGGPLLDSPLPGSVTEIIENVDALPRAYQVRDFRIAGDAEALELWTGNGSEYRSLVLLDRDPGFAPSHPGPPAAAAEIVSHQFERVEIHATTEHPSVLVLTDSFYPGWSVRVDGKEASILRANGVYRAVALASGNHEVVFEYTPSSLRWGTVISSASMLAAFAVPWVARSRRSESSPAVRTTARQI